MKMKRRQFFHTAGSSITLPFMFTACGKFMSGNPSHNLVATPESRTQYLDAMLYKLCTEIGPRPVGSANFNAGADIIYEEFSKSLPDVERDKFTFENWAVNGPISLTVGGRSIPCLALELTAGTSEEGVSGIIVPTDDQRKPYAIKKTVGSETLAFINIANPKAGTTFGTSMESSSRNIPVVRISANDRPIINDAVKNGASVIYIANIAFEPDTPTTNIVGSLPGKSDKEILFLAHQDTVYSGPGANDNTASLLTIVMLAHALSGTRPNNTLRFIATAGHELGFHGARHYVERRKKEGTINRILHSFNFDSVTWGPNIVFRTTDAVVLDTMERIDKENNIPGTPIVTKEDGATLDNSPFRDTGVTCVYVGSRGYDHQGRVQHGPADTPDTVPHDAVETTFLLLREYIRRTESV